MKKRAKANNKRREELPDSATDAWTGRARAVLNTGMFPAVVQTNGQCGETIQQEKSLSSGGLLSPCSLPFPITQSLLSHRTVHNDFPGNTYQPG